VNGTFDLAKEPLLRVLKMRRSANIQRLFILGLTVPIVALNVWVLSQVFRYFEHLITLLTIAAILAFLLNYAVELFERIKITRVQAVIVVLFLTMTLLLILGLTLVPAVIDQTTQLLSKIPEWLEASQKNLENLDRWARAHRLPVDLKVFGTRITANIENQLPTLPTQALGLALGTLTGLLNTILVLVLAFYMLLYGERLWKGLLNLLPPDIGVPLGESLRLNFQNFFISQLLLGLFMVGVLTPIFLSLRVPFALLFALLIGIAELIPFIGATLGIGLVVILVGIQSQNIWLVFQTALAAIVMQQIKDNLLAPRVMGNFTGLNPIWIFIALLMGVQIAGFLGVLVAVPIAGTIKGTIDAIRGVKRSQVVSAEIISQEPVSREPPLN
jgi:predicted PurR-regulated permease PerM